MTDIMSIQAFSDIVMCGECIYWGQKDCPMRFEYEFGTTEDEDYTFIRRNNATDADMFCSKGVRFM